MTAPDLTSEAVEVTEELEGGFSRRTLGWIIGSVAVSFAVTLLLTIRAETVDRRPPPENNSFSYSALGHNAVVEFLERIRIVVLSSRSPSGGDIGPQRPLVLAEPNPREPVWDRERLRELADRATSRKAPLVLVLPKWRAGAPRKDRPEWLERVRIWSKPAALRAASALHPSLVGISIRRVRQVRRCSSASENFAVQVDPLQLLEPSPNMTALVSCGSGVLVAEWAATDASPRILVISDPDLLNNQGLGRADHAQMIYQIFKRDLGATGAVFDETIHGLTRTPGLLVEATSFPLVLAVLQGLVLLGIVLWAGMGRFGKPLPLSLGLAAGKEILIDNTAKLLENGGHAADGVVRYFRQVTRAVAAHYFLPPDLPDNERLAKLQQITNARGVRMHLADLEQTLLHLPAGRPGEDLAVRYARRLHEWRVEMTNGH
jgi:hypothetical protein